MRNSILLLLLICSIEGYGQFTKGNFYFGGQIQFESSNSYNDILNIEPHVGFFLTNRMTIGATAFFDYLFIAGQDPIFSIDPYLRYYVINKKCGVFLLTGGKFIVGDNPYKNYPPIPFRPKLGLGLSYFITEHIIVDTSFDIYIYKRNSATIISENLTTGLIVKF